MNMGINWLPDSLIFLTVHGSQAYGLAHSQSDLDIKGICIPPREIRDGLFQGFDQALNHEQVNSDPRVLARQNPTNPKVESTVYSLRKFFKLAAEVNPNVIELLYTDPSDHLSYGSSPIKEQVCSLLMERRDEFLSSKAKYTFTGYAAAQLAKINRHRKWLLAPVTKQPVRADFGLTDSISNTVEPLLVEIRRQVESWNWHQFKLEELERAELKESCWDLCYWLTNSKRISWDAWPDAHWRAAYEKVATNCDLSSAIREAVLREHKYELALQAFNSYNHWLKNRNPERKVLEEKFQYDVKHGSHLVRLLRMGYEILTEGRVYVRRPDAKELIEIRNGNWSYDMLLQYAEQMNRRIEEAYTYTKLPRSVNYTQLNEFYQQLINLGGR